MSEDNNILFQRYLDKDLSEEEINAFEKKCLDDSSFKSDFDLYVLLEGHLEEKVEYGDAMDVLKAVGHKRKNNKGLFHFLWRNKFLIVGLLFLLSCFIGTQYLSSKADNMPAFASAYEDPIYPDTRNNTTDLSRVLLKIRTSKNISLIDSLHNLSSISQSEKEYWIAETHLLLNNSDSSLLYIRNLKASKYKYQRILYLEALNYIKTDSEVLYKDFLKKYKNTLDQYYLDKLTP